MVIKLTPMINIIKKCEDSIDNLLKEENLDKTITKLDNYEETNFKRDDISITSINYNNKQEYLILDKRVHPTLIIIKKEKELKTKIKMTIADTPQVIKIKEVEKSSTIINYFEDLNLFIKSIHEEKKGQVKTK